MSHSRRLQARIELVEPRLQEQLQRFWEHPEFPEVFRTHLCGLYHSVHASVPLLRCALARCTVLAPDCPVAQRLVPYYTQHISEETDHDTWLLDEAPLAYKPIETVMEDSKDLVETVTVLKAFVNYKGL